MQPHITEKMIDAAVKAAVSEAIKDGREVPDMNGEAMARFREVAHSMLQAAANTLKEAPHEQT